jgi:hypothetical protein
MEEVYRARDTRPGRDVAIKVLPEEFSLDKERPKLLESTHTRRELEGGIRVMEPHCRQCSPNRSLPALVNRSVRGSEQLNVHYSGEAV